MCTWYKLYSKFEKCIWLLGTSAPPYFKKIKNYSLKFQKNVNLNYIKSLQVMTARTSPVPPIPQEKALEQAKEKT
jgi:hypothetical protein